MDPERDALLATLAAKDEIRELALLYARGVDRQDFALLETLYTRDGVDHHGDYFHGSAADYVRFLRESLPRVRYTGHHICNHLISLAGPEGEGEGEVYAIAWHVTPGSDGELVEDVQLVRYLDRYRKEDGRWRFARREVAFDVHVQRPLDDPDAAAPVRGEDLSYSALAGRLFARGPRG
jgi:hypothetical protein